MPTLSNPRHEKFAQSLASGQTATAAYAGAGYNRSRAHASRLAADGNVRGRVEELIQSAAEKAETHRIVTIDALTNMLLEDRALAHASSQASAAVTATEKIARLHGFSFEPK